MVVFLNKLKKYLGVAAAFGLVFADVNQKSHDPSADGPDYSILDIYTATSSATVSLFGEHFVPNTYTGEEQPVYPPPRVAQVRLMTDVRGGSNLKLSSTLFSRVEI